MLHLLLGRAKTGKTTRLYQAMRENGKHRPQVLIVPEQYSHEAERRLCQELGGGASAWAEVLSFTRLYHRVLTETGGLAQPMLDSGGQLLLMHQAVHAVSSQLTLYAKPSKKAAFLEHLLATRGELKSYCIQPQQLMEAGDNAPEGEGQRLRELGLMLECYDTLTQRLASDPRDRLTRLAEQLKTCAYGRGADFYLDSFVDFTPQQRQVLTQLMSKAHAVTVALTCDTMDNHSLEVFAPARRTALTLQADAKACHTPMTFEILTGRKDEAPTALASLEQLFQTGEPLQETPPTGVHLIQAETPYLEVEQAAQTICKLVQEGLRYRDMVVAGRTMEDYAGLLEPVFGRYGIPLFYSHRESILEKPILTLLTAALETVGDGYEYDSLFRYLKTGLTGISLEEVDLLENYVLRWELRGSQWSREAAWNWHPEGYSRKWTAVDEAAVAELDALRRRVIAPLETLRKTQAAPGADLVRVLYGFLEDIQLPQRLQERSEQLRERGELRQAEEYRQLWGILCGAMEQCADLLTEGIMELREFADLFGLLLSQYDVSAIPVSLDRVSAGEIQHLSHKEAKVLLLLGADEDHFPLVTQAPGLLTDSDRSWLQAIGLEVAPSADQRLDREQMLLYEGLALPHEQLFISWPRTKGGAATNPARFVEQIQGLLPKLTVTHPDSDTCPMAPLPALEWAGRHRNDALLDALEQEPEWNLRTRRVRLARQYTRGGLSRGAVNALYGHKVRLSASKMDTIKSCHFSYFMQYGLKAKARKRAGFDAPEAGTFVHYVLEHFLRDAKEQGGVQTMSHDQRKAKVKEVVEQYIREELGDLEGQSPRFRYLFRRLCQSVELVVQNVVEELEHSHFQPISFELGFGDGKALPPVELTVELTVDGVTLSISGIVDRVDGWAENGRLYLRVVDYKTGKKSFSLTDVWHGLEMQMLLYLFTLEQSGKSLYGQDPTAAGVLYLPARDLILSGSRDMTPAQRQAEVDKKLRRSGMLLDDPEVLAAMETLGATGKHRFLPLKVSKKTGEITGDSLATAEQWGKLRRHVGKILRDIAGEIGTGNIDADPYLRSGNRSYCDFCDYADACFFEEGSGRDCHRYLYPVKGQRFWESAGADENEERGQQHGG